MKNLELQGHRGCRGLFPENTIPGFIYAQDLGVTLEMDVVISKDYKVVVSHDPYFLEELCDLESLLDKSIYQCNYSEIKKVDCGSKFFLNFPQQIKLKISKPLLSDVLEAILNYQKKNLKSLHYNIEIKSSEEGDNRLHPTVDVFCDLVMEVLKNHDVLNNSTIQSFDKRALRYVHKHYPSIQLSLLIEGNETVKMHLDDLGFVPKYLSPDYKLVNRKFMEESHKLGMLVLPWTVNTLPEMRNLLALGVDGLISDYPNLYSQI